MRRASPDQRNHSYSRIGGVRTPARTQALATSRGEAPASIDSSTAGAASGSGRSSQDQIAAAAPAAASMSNTISTRSSRIIRPSRSRYETLLPDRP